jgi:uncharacterized protein with von Willebrand factor type A (vWA) domain
MTVGPSKVLDAVQGVARVGIERRDDFYWALHAILVSRHEQHFLFDQAFRIFWQIPDEIDGPLENTPGEKGENAEEDLEPLARRLADAMRESHNQNPDEPDQTETDAVMTWSMTASLGGKDFEQMTAEEIEAAKQAVLRMRLPISEMLSRRFTPNRTGNRIDVRRTLNRAVRSGGDIIPLAWRTRRRKRPPLVVLCDISGSMNRYARMFLHFLHVLSAAHGACHVFVFGTELTNITRHLKHKDVDEALSHIGEAVDDWSGGTRIGLSLHEFNREWGRRVLGQGATVLLISDGLDRDGADGITHEMERLQHSCRRLIWLNPLMRFDEYAPLALGAAALSPHVDDMRTIHNLDSMEDLAATLSGSKLSHRAKNVERAA